MFHISSKLTHVHGPLQGGCSDENKTYTTRINGAHVEPVHGSNTVIWNLCPGQHRVKKTDKVHSRESFAQCEMWPLKMNIYI